MDGFVPTELGGPETLEDLKFCNLDGDLLTHRLIQGFLGSGSDEEVFFENSLRPLVVIIGFFFVSLKSVETGLITVDFE